MSLIYQHKIIAIMLLKTIRKHLNNYQEETIEDFKLNKQPLLCASLSKSLRVSSDFERIIFCFCYHPFPLCYTVDKLCSAQYNTAWKTGNLPSKIKYACAFLSFSALFSVVQKLKLIAHLLAFVHLCRRYLRSETVLRVLQ